MNTNPLAQPRPNPACALFGRVTHGRMQGEKADEPSRLPGLELGRLPVLPHLVVADDHLRTEFQFPAVVAFIQRVVVEDAVDDALFVVPALHDDPHPLAEHATLALELD